MKTALRFRRVFPYVLAFTAATGCTATELRYTADDRYAVPWVVGAAPEEVVDGIADAIAATEHLRDDDASLRRPPADGTPRPPLTARPGRWRVIRTDPGMGTIQVQRRIVAFAPADVLVRGYAVPGNRTLLKAWARNRLVGRGSGALHELMELLEGYWHRRGIAAAPAGADIGPVQTETPPW